MTHNADQVIETFGAAGDENKLSPLREHQLVTLPESGEVWIHGDHADPSGAEDSWLMLYESAQLKCDFPNQVHFLLANHDLAQIHGEGIMKAGTSVCEAFNSAVKRDFKEQA